MSENLSDNLEERLRDYAATIDAATLDDLAARDLVEPDPRPRAPHPRRRATVLALLAIAGVTVLAVLLVGHGDRHIRIETSPPGSSSTTSPSTSPCDPHGGDSAACPEEGPPLTPEQRARFAQWRSEYNPVDVARVAHAQIGAGALDDVTVVETMEGDIGCTVTRAAWAAAKHAQPTQRPVVVDNIMRDELARLTERDWPPQSQMPNIFRRIAEQLRTGDLARFTAPRSLYDGECGHALQVQP